MKKCEQKSTRRPLLLAGSCASNFPCVGTYDYIAYLPFLSLSLSQEKLDQTEDKLASTEADVARLQMDLARVTAAEHSLRQEHSDAKIQHAELEADLRHTVRTRKE